MEKSTAFQLFSEIRGQSILSTAIKKPFSTPKRFTQVAQSHYGCSDVTSTLCGALCPCSVPLRQKQGAAGQGGPAGIAKNKGYTYGHSSKQQHGAVCQITHRTISLQTH